MTDTPTARLRELLQGSSLTGRTPGEVTDTLLMQIPLGDAGHWMRGTVLSMVRREMRDQGLVITHTDGSQTGPAMQPALLDYAEFVDFGRYRLKQVSESEASLRLICEEWLAAHTSIGLSVDDLMTAFAA